MSTLEDIQIDLATLIDGTITPPTGDDYNLRTRLINKAVEKLYSLRDWEHLAKDATLTFSANGTLGECTVSDLRDNGVIDLRESGSTDAFVSVSFDELRNSRAVGNRFTLTGQKIQTNQPTKTSLQCRYIPTPTTLTISADTVDFPSMLVAKKAMVEYRLIEDPEEINVIQKAEQMFEKEYAEYLGTQAPKRKVFTSKAWNY